jgi:hypothetical protein
MEQPMQRDAREAAPGRALPEPKAGRGNLRIAALSDPSVPRFVSRPTRVMVSEIQSA